MVKKAVNIISVVAILLTVALAWAIFSANPTNTQPPPTNGIPIFEDVVALESPIPGSIVKSPLTITGRARGIWYFEASFPVEIIDANGNQLGQHYAQAQSEWMTVEFVPFLSTLTFKNSPTDTGFLILHKDNPSGLPEHDREVRYPIRFR